MRGDNLKMKDQKGNLCLEYVFKKTYKKKPNKTKPDA